MGNLFVIVTSVLSSTVFAAIVSFSFAEAKERQLLRRQKIEEIYLHADEWLKAVNAYYLPAIAVCEGQITHNAMFELQNSGGDNVAELGLRGSRVKMNIFMYEPSLIPYYERMMIEREKTALLLIEIGKCYNKIGQSTEFLHPFQKQLVAFDGAGEDLIKAILARGITIAAEKGQAAQAYEAARLALKSISSKVNQFYTKLSIRNR